MSKIIVLPVLVFSVLLGSCSESRRGSSSSPIFQLTSSASEEGFDSGEMIPTEFWDNHDTQCMGANNFPKISWTGAPDGTNSFVLIMEDQSTTPTNFVHLNLYDIPADATSIPRIEATASGDMEAVDFTEYGNVGANDWTDSSTDSNPNPNPNTTGWAGPCPLEDDPHTYSFKLYALSEATISELESLQKTQGDFETTYGSTGNDAILGMAELTATDSQMDATEPPEPPEPSQPPPQPQPEPFALLSSEMDEGFDPGGVMPNEFLDNHNTQCTGSNNFPQISWGNAPAGTLSFVLIIEDDQSTTPLNFVHLNLYDIPTTISSIPRIVATASGAQETVNFTSNGTSYGKTGRNGWFGLGTASNPSPNTTGWAGPCPPSGSGVHTYSFKLYALNIANLQPSLNNAIDQSQFEAYFLYPQPGGTILGTAEIRVTAEFQ